MTRYARGNKGRSQRNEEEPTPWNKLKRKGKKNLQSDKLNSSNTRECRLTNAEVVETKNKEYNKNNVRGKNNKAVSKRVAHKTSSIKDVPIKWNTDNANSVESIPENDTNLKSEVYKRRKPISDIPSIYVNGSETRIARFEGFPVKKDDAERLKTLRRKLLSMKVPRDELVATLKAERRRAEKALSRDRKKVCFHCRHSGHMLSQCPNLTNTDENSATISGICFKCGSTEHQHNECRAVKSDNYKFAVCFICKEEGHISKQCPDNPRGLYPQGGACRMCGDVTHLKKDCPEFVKQKQEEFDVTATIINNEMPDALDEDFTKKKTKTASIKKRKIIKMNK